MAKKLTESEIQKNLNDKFDGKITIVYDTYINCETPALFIDEDFGKFWAKYLNVIRTCGNKERTMQKKKETWIKTLGVDHPMHSDKVKAKIKNTCVEVYGCKNPFQNEDIKNKIKKVMLAKYGVEHNMHVLEIATKNAKSNNRSIILYHWKTKEELVCVGSYEAAVVQYLNKNKINFKWQPKIFNLTLKNGKKTTYRPDLYLVGKKKPWIEIKGFFRKDAKEKWDVFQELKPNSQLWDKKALKKMGIL